MLAVVLVGFQNSLVQTEEGEGVLEFVLGTVIEVAPVLDPRPPEPRTLKLHSPDNL